VISVLFGAKETKEVNVLIGLCSVMKVLTQTVLLFLLFHCVLCVFAKECYCGVCSIFLVIVLMCFTTRKSRACSLRGVDAARQLVRALHSSVNEGPRLGA
jgi:hypothetical protein